MAGTKDDSVAKVTNAAPSSEMEDTSRLIDELTAGDDDGDEANLEDEELDQDEDATGDEDEDLDEDDDADSEDEDEDGGEEAGGDGDIVDEITGGDDAGDGKADFAFARQRRRRQQADQRSRNLELENARLKGQIEAGIAGKLQGADVSPLAAWEEKYKADNGIPPDDSVSPPASVFKAELAHRDKVSAKLDEQKSYQRLGTLLHAGAKSLTESKLGTGLGMDEITATAAPYLTPGRNAVLMEIGEDVINGRKTPEEGAKAIYTMCFNAIKESGGEDAEMLMAAARARKKGGKKGGKPKKGSAGTKPKTRGSEARQEVETERGETSAAVDNLMATMFPSG